MPDVYFSTVQAYYHSDFASALQGGQSLIDTNETGYNLKMYSFALRANKHQPCGTCNFSRLDTASMTFTYDFGPPISAVPEDIYLYAVNFNILRIKNGLAGIAFSS
jgi:hypothetical protein